VRLLAIPYSTNVERVRLALGYKGLDAEIEMVEASGDRARVREVSGQDLVPVLIDGDAVIYDSSAILSHLDVGFPERPLFPVDPRRRAEAVVFLQWFNQVWKGPPNEIDALADDAGARQRRIELGLWMDDSLAVFDGLLADRSHLLGDSFGIADCIAFPFLKYANQTPAEDDPDRFHQILAEHLALRGRYPRLRDWIERVDALPRGGRPR
jgi:glutathione S-transferase